MKEFVVNLFKNPNFPTYCGIAIAVLASLFIIIFALGKRDKKKFDETQALKLDEINKKNEEILARQAVEAKAKEEYEAAHDAPPVVDDTPVVAPIVPTPSSFGAPSAPSMVKPNPATEVVPVINPDDIPPTPLDAMPVPVTSHDDDVYRVNDEDTNSIVETNDTRPSEFSEFPEIEPVMPENTIEHLRSLNAELDKDITSLENVTAPKVAPVEIISDTLDVTPTPVPNSVSAPVTPTPLPNTAPAPNPTPVQQGMVRPQIFSAVNVPNNLTNDEIDSL